MKKKTDYWFKTRPYGYGWVPVTKQGFWVIISFILFVIAGSFVLEFASSQNIDLFLTLYFVGLILAVAALLIIVRKHGPKTRWRWGRSDKDNPDEDFNY